MADSDNGLYLIAYDIANPKRLSRVHKTLKKQGLPVQYSVFTVVMKRKALLRLLESLNALIKIAVFNGSLGSAQLGADSGQDHGIISVFRSQIDRRFR